VHKDILIFFFFFFFNRRYNPWWVLACLLFDHSVFTSAIAFHFDNNTKPKNSSVLNIQAGDT